MLKSLADAFQSLWSGEDAAQDATDPYAGKSMRDGIPYPRRLTAPPAVPARLKKYERLGHLNPFLLEGLFRSLLRGYTPPSPAELPPPPPTTITTAPRSPTSDPPTPPLPPSIAPNTTPGPPLPPEIVLLIFRHASFLRPARPLPLSLPPNQAIAVLSRGPKATHTILSTPPLTAPQLARVHSIQLFTDSHDQGYVSDRGAGSYSWFEIGLVAGPEDDPQVRTRMVEHPEDGTVRKEELVWRSHENRLGDNRWDTRVGKTFGPEDELWREAREGDRLVVRACAQFPMWQNFVRSGRLEWAEWWEPALRY